jgi:predicted dehydrogenase
MSNVHDNPESQLVAVSDVVAEKAEAASEKFGAKPYTDYREMLDREDLQAVYVCVPPHAHGEMEIFAAEKGLALFIEKPLASDPENPENIAKAIQKAGVVSSVGYNWRYSDMTDRALEMLKDRPVGLVVGYWMGGLPGVGWWRVKSMSGGQQVEQTTHIFDMARCLAGEVKTVYASAGLQCMGDVEGLDVEDASAVNLEFENGAPGVVLSTCMLSQGHNVFISIFSKDLALEVSQNQLKMTMPQKEKVLKSKVNPYLREDSIFINAVSTGDESEIKSSYADALLTHRVTMAANRSIETGKPENP